MSANPQPPDSAAEGEPVLQRADENGISTLTLNRPTQFNSLSSELLSALHSEIESLANDDTIRVVVIAAKGKAFCAGHDLKEMKAMKGADGAKDQRAFEGLFAQCSRMMLAIVACPKPVIAKVQGVATAAGCQLVATCDLAIASRSAQFGTSGINMGLFCSTPMVALSRNVSRKKAMEMLLTGDLIDAETAVEYGLINHAVAAEKLDMAVAEMADKISAKSAPAIAFGKAAFYRQIEAGLKEAYEHTASVMACNMGTEDVSEGLDAFTAKRLPTWKHR